MANIKIITDSTSCIPQEYAHQHDISVVDLMVNLDDTVAPEGNEADWNKYFEKLKISKSFPKTSQPTPNEFAKLYNKILAQNDNNVIIVITLSASLSGTYNSALLASQDYGDKVFVVDSGQTAQSQLLLIEEVVQLINDGLSITDILQKIETIKEKITISFVPHTMEYLKRGGRINLISATIASLLQIKPILSFKNGVLSKTKQGLGMQKVLTELVSDMPKIVKKLYVVYVHESEWVTKLIDMLNKHLDTAIDCAYKVGSVVGSHLGIGAVGIAFTL